MTTAFATEIVVAETPFSAPSGHPLANRSRGRGTRLATARDEARTAAAPLVELIWSLSRDSGDGRLWSYALAKTLPARVAVVSQTGSRYSVMCPEMPNGGGMGALPWDSARYDLVAMVVLDHDTGLVVAHGCRVTISARNHEGAQHELRVRPGGSATLPPEFVA